MILNEAAALLNWLDRRGSDRKVAGTMPVQGINVVVSEGKTHSAYFLKGSLCGVKNKHKWVFQNGIYRRKKIKKTNK